MQFLKEIYIIKENSYIFITVSKKEDIEDIYYNLTNNE
jgi:hypothetical protein